MITKDKKPEMIFHFYGTSWPINEVVTMYIDDKLMCGDDKILCLCLRLTNGEVVLERYFGEEAEAVLEGYEDKRETLRLMKKLETLLRKEVERHSKLYS